MFNIGIEKYVLVAEIGALAIAAGAVYELVVKPILNTEAGISNDVSSAINNNPITQYGESLTAGNIAAKLNPAVYSNATVQVVTSNQQAQAAGYTALQNAAGTNVNGTTQGATSTVIYNSSNNTISGAGSIINGTPFDNVNYYSTTQNPLGSSGNMFKTGNGYQGVGWYVTPSGVVQDIGSETEYNAFVSKYG